MSKVPALIISTRSWKKGLKKTGDITDGSTSSIEPGVRLSVTNSQ